MNKFLKTVQSWALFVPEIKSLLQQKDFTTLKNVLKEIHPVDLAEGWFSFSAEEKNVIFRLLSTRRAVEVFEDLEYEDQLQILNSLDDASLGNIISDMPSDKTLKLFHKLPQKTIKKLSALMHKEEMEKITTTMKYPKDTAGALMNIYFISVSPNITAKQALEKVQALARTRRIENFHSIYVTDDENRLIGGFSLRRLVSSPQDIRINEIMSPVELIKINVLAKSDEVARLFTKYNLVNAPVVDKDNHLLGVINIDDVVDIIHKQAESQVYGLGKISNVERTVEIDYSKATVLSLVKTRVVWLFVLLLIGAFVSGRILQGYSTVLETVIILAAFIPMLMDSGGNAGQQALVMVVRGLATGEVVLKQFIKIFFRELRIGFLVGIVMGIVAMVSVFILHGFNIPLGLTVGLSLLAVITIATTAGAMLPILFKWLGFDPAVAASPFITTIVDATCLIVYFEVAKRLVLK